MPFFFKTYTINVLLAGVLVVQVASAHPFTDTNGRNLITGEGIDSDANVNHPKLSTADFPSMGYACPKTDKYADITTYTSGQLTKAYAKAAKYANEGTTFETSSSHPPPATVNLITASRGEGAF
ncbi:hypothetical protein BDV27DRAFT_152572 [Aspergillus caelatus]|uniref:Uncharacterized protein n=1 Tax=Aspergillus caelatus TaxID=61420 RepID=A0A5N7AJI0_9EURO|nr:uncharacterized protein BDV27DRAFT_152572 [Aspergillus caelatus]KAE8369915.1 hypothetical protein BDV27DRAFT_152572 [Aspergillus caelatus]